MGFELGARWAHACLGLWEDAKRRAVASAKANQSVWSNLISAGQTDVKLDISYNMLEGKKCGLDTTNPAHSLTLWSGMESGLMGSIYGPVWKLVSSGGHAGPYRPILG